MQRRKSLEVIPALICVTLLTMSLGSNIYKVHFKHALTSSDLSFSWKDVFLIANLQGLLEFGKLKPDSKCYTLPKPLKLLQGTLHRPRKPQFVPSRLQ